MANISKAERERRATAAQTEAEMADTEQKDASQDVDAEEIKYVKMTRNPEFYDEPIEANVHPHEVSNYARGGWEIA